MHTKSGVALVANDMHLDLGVPAVWYPARLRVTGDASLDVTGVTLPGTPAVAAGSNGHVAWGFTNSYGDFSDMRFGAVRRRRITAVRARTHRGEGCRGCAGRSPTATLAAGVVLDGEEYADDVSERRMRAGGAGSRRVPRRPTSHCLALERARDRRRRAGARAGRRHSRAEPGGRRLAADASPGRWSGRVPRSAGADRLFGALEFRDAQRSSAHRRSAGRPALDREPARGRRTRSRQ